MTPILLKYHAAITLRVYNDAISSSERLSFLLRGLSAPPPLWSEPEVPEEEGRRILVVG
tara:strand:+ start:3131 stop:3307 length:177 start_codon:yes stop_codon:yes gene_type:complete